MSASGVRDRAVGGHRDVVAGAAQPSPRVALVAGVARHPRHRERVQRLQQEGGDPAGEHRRVLVHPPDRVGRHEPALARRAPDLQAALPRVAARHLRAQHLTQPALDDTDAGTGLMEPIVPDRAGWSRHLPRARGRETRCPHPLITEGGLGSRSSAHQAIALAHRQPARRRDLLQVPQDIDLPYEPTVTHSGPAPAPGPGGPGIRDAGQWPSDQADVDQELPARRPRRDRPARRAR